MDSADGRHPGEGVGGGEIPSPGRERGIEKSRIVSKPPQPRGLVGLYHLSIINDNALKKLTAPTKLCRASLSMPRPSIPRSPRGMLERPNRSVGYNILFPEICSAEIMFLSHVPNAIKSCSNKPIFDVCILDFRIFGIFGFCWL